MDSLLYIGAEDVRMCALLKKLGYRVVIGGKDEPVHAAIDRGDINLIVLDSRLDENPEEMVRFLKSYPGSKAVPLVYLPPASSETTRDLTQEFGRERVEIIAPPYSVGSIVSKVATELRLSKMSAQEDESKATMADLNSTLKELNQRFARELDDARIIQEMLLPRSLPVDPRFELSVFYKPLEEVGGDWYFIDQPEENIVLIDIADVTGHGLSAAFIGSMTKLACKNADTRMVGARLAKINSLLGPHLPEGRFLTMGSLRYETNSGAVSFASAGHPSAVVVRGSTGETKELGARGFAIGLIEDAEYVEVNETLLKGDTLLLVTDGLTEAQNRGEELFGKARLVEALRQSAGSASASVVVKSVVRALKDFMDDRRYGDDVTVLALRRLE